MVQCAKFHANRSNRYRDMAILVFLDGVHPRLEFLKIRYLNCRYGSPPQTVELV